MSVAVTDLQPLNNVNKLTFYSFAYQGLFFRFSCHEPAILIILLLTFSLFLSHFPSLSLSHTLLRSSSLCPDSNRLRCPGTTLLKSNQAWVMRRVIGPLPPEQGQSLEDMIDHDRSTMAAWCQRSGMGAHGPPAVKLRHPTQLCIKLLHTHDTYAHSDTCGLVQACKMSRTNKARPCAPICECKNTLTVSQTTNFQRILK